MACELWSGASGSLLNVYATEAEALAAVRELAGLNEPEYVAELGLLYVDGQGETQLVAEGADLQARAEQAAA